MGKWSELAKFIVAGILLALVQFVVPDMPHWVKWIGIGVCVVVLARLYKPSKVTVPQSIPRRNHDTIQPYKNVIRISQQAPSRRPPKILNIGQIILSSLMLSFGIYLLVHMIQGIQFGIWAILFLALFLGIPSFTLVDTLWLQPKQCKLGKSGAAREKDLTLLGNINGVFDKVIRVANEMRITPYEMDRPRKLIGYSQGSFWYGPSIITITIRRLPQGRVKIHVLSDADWVTVKWDIFGHNRRIVNRFVRLMSSESDYMVVIADIVTSNYGRRGKSWGLVIQNTGADKAINCIGELRMIEFADPVGMTLATWPVNQPLQWESIPVGSSKSIDIPASSKAVLQIANYDITTPKRQNKLHLAYYLSEEFREQHYLPRSNYLEGNNYLIIICVSSNNRPTIYAVCYMANRILTTRMFLLGVSDSEPTLDDCHRMLASHKAEIEKQLALKGYHEKGKDCSNY